MKNVADFLVHLEGEAVSDVQHIQSWLVGKTPQIIKVFRAGAAVSSTFVKAMESPEGKTVEAIIATVAPQVGAWTPAIETIVTKLGTAMLKVADVIPAYEGIALRMCAEVIHELDGGKLGKIDQYILEAQKLFTKPVAIAAA